MNHDEFLKNYCDRSALQYGQMRADLDALIEAEKAEATKPLVEALKAWQIAKDAMSPNHDGEDLYERMIELDAAEVWESGEDLIAWAENNARAALEGKG